MTIILDDYKTFDNKADLNEAVRLHLSANKYELNATAIKTLEVISRHAVKHGGAAWLKIDTLAGLIGKSAPTARRAVALLERLGIVERIAYMRPKSGGNGGNIIRILVIDCPEVIDRKESEKPCEASVEQPNEPEETINLKSYKSITTETESADALKHAIPERLYKAIAPYFNASEFYKFIGLLWRSKASVRRDLTVEDHEQAYIDAFKATVFKYKQGKLRNIYGYLYRAWQKVTSTVDRKIGIKSGQGAMCMAFSDWLDA